MKISRTMTSPDGRYQIDVKLFEYPESTKSMNSHWYSLRMGSDRNVYIGLSDHITDACLCRFRPREESMEVLGNVLEALSPQEAKEEDHGKIHVGPYQDKNGAVYFATYSAERHTGGRLFQYTPEKGMVSLGKYKPDQSFSFMLEDEENGKLYFTTTPEAHFVVYDLATGTWEDKGWCSSALMSPFSGLTDDQGRLYLYGCIGEFEKKKRKPTIARYDPKTKTYETSKDAPPSLWVGAVSPDGKTAYTTSWKTTELFRWRFSDWPHFKAERLGRMHPDSKKIYSHNLSFIHNNRTLLVGGSVVPERTLFNFWKKPQGYFHGLWTYEVETGKKTCIAGLNEILSESFGLDMGQCVCNWTNANTVDPDGWVYIGLHNAHDLDHQLDAKVRLLAVRINETGT